MAITDYASLQTATLNWLNKVGDSDATARVLDWITLAEDELIDELTRSPLRQGETVNQAFTVATEYSALPTGFLRARELVIQGQPNTPVEYVAPTSIDRFTNFTGTNGRPIYYTIQGNQLRSIPVPNSSYTATFTYQALTPLSVSNTTNWLLTNHPKIYLSATLAEAHAYYENLDGYTAATGAWQRLFASAFAASGPSAVGGPLQMRTDNGNP